MVRLRMTRARLDQFSRDEFTRIELIHSGNVVAVHKTIDPSILSKLIQGNHLNKPTSIATSIEFSEKKLELRWTSSANCKFSFSETILISFGVWSHKIRNFDLRNINKQK